MNVVYCSQIGTSAPYRVAETPELVPSDGGLLGKSDVASAC